MKKIRDYIENLFEKVPSNRKNDEIKEELILDLEEKYSDLIKAGTNDKEAYKEVITGIGDIDEMIEKLGNTDIKENIYYSEILKRRKIKGLVISVSVFMYIISFVWIAIFDELGYPDYVTISGFFTIAGLATCILIYYNVSTPKIKIDEVVIKQQTEKVQSDRKAVRDAISGIVWTLILIIYFIVSFLTNAWHITWVLFMIGILIESVTSLIFSLRGDKNE